MPPSRPSKELLDYHAWLHDRIHRESHDTLSAAMVTSARVKTSRKHTPERNTHTNHLK